MTGMSIAHTFYEDKQILSLLASSAEGAVLTYGVVKPWD